MKKQPNQRIILVPLLSFLLASAAIALLFVPRFSARAFAARDSATVTCNIQPEFNYCTNRDPVDQQCAILDTTVSKDIIAFYGITIGRTSRSPLLPTRWGVAAQQRRIYDDFVGDTLNTLPIYDVSFSNRVFDSVNASAPGVTGTLTTGGKPDRALSAPFRQLLRQ